MKEILLVVIIFIMIVFQELKMCRINRITETMLICVLNAASQDNNINVVLLQDSLIDTKVVKCDNMETFIDINKKLVKSDSCNMVNTNEKLNGVSAVHKPHMVSGPKPYQHQVAGASKQIGVNFMGKLPRRYISLQPQCQKGLIRNCTWMPCLKLQTVASQTI